MFAIYFFPFLLIKAKTRITNTIAKIDTATVRTSYENWSKSDSEVGVGIGVIDKRVGKKVETNIIYSTRNFATLWFLQICVELKLSLWDEPYPYIYTGEKF